MLTGNAYIRKKLLDMLPKHEIYKKFIIRPHNTKNFALRDTNKKIKISRIEWKRLLII